MTEPCPACGQGDLEPFGGKDRCPACGYLQPCCDLTGWQRLDVGQRIEYYRQRDARQPSGGPR